MNRQSRISSLAPSILKAITAHIRAVHTTMPGEVVEYDASKQAIAAKPLLMRGILDERGERIVESLPVINDVPVMFPGGGGFRLTFPIKKGDVVLLVFAEASIDRWLVKGGEVDPKDDRHHALSDAIAIPGLSTLAEAKGASNAAMVLEGSDVRLGGDDADDPVIRLSDLEELASDVFDAWTPVANDGGSALKTRWTTLRNTGWPKGSSIVKAK